MERSPRLRVARDRHRRARRVRGRRAAKLQSDGSPRPLSNPAVRGSEPPHLLPLRRALRHLLPAAIRAHPGPGVHAVPQAARLLHGGRGSARPRCRRMARRGGVLARGVPGKPADRGRRAPDRPEPDSRNPQPLRRSARPDRRPARRRSASPRSSSGSSRRRPRDGAPPASSGRSLSAPPRSSRSLSSSGEAPTRWCPSTSFEFGCSRE